MRPVRKRAAGAAGAAGAGGGAGADRPVGPHVGPHAGAASETRIVVGGANYGIASTGDHAVNTLIQYQVTRGSAEFRAVAELTARDLPVLSTFDEKEPVGRAAIIEQVAAELAVGMSVQLYGQRGVGKKAVARAVIRRLSARPDPVVGVELLPQGDQPHTLESLYEHLASSFFHGVTVDPPEPRLRAAAVAANLTAVVVIGDCDLASGDLTRLLGTFPNCAFLVTSTHRTLYRTGSAHEIAPIDLDAAIELVAEETGYGPAGLRRLQVAQAYQMAAGQAQRLLQYAAFLRFSLSRPGPDPLSVVPPHDQAKILAVGLSEPARRVLVALATFGGELSSDCFAAVTGLPADPAAGPAPAEVGRELLATALATRAEVRDRAAARSGAAGVDGAVGADGTVYRITGDAAHAVRVLGWAPADARTAARGLLTLLAGDQVDAVVRPAMLVAVASTLRAEREDLLASRFIRAAMPAALRAGQFRAWTRLLELGLEVAAAARDETDLAYFLGEDVAWRGVGGDKIAAAAAVLGAELSGSSAAARSLSGAGRRTRSLRRVLTQNRVGLLAAVALAAAVVIASTAVLLPRLSRLLGSARPASGATATGTAPAIAYATANSVVLRDGTGPSRVLSHGGATALAWSADGKQVAWLTASSLGIAQVGGGPARTWSCDCRGLAFQGDRAVTVTAADAGSPQSLAVAVPELLAFSAHSQAPVKEPVSGITRGPNTDFMVLSGIARGAVVVAYGSAGGTDFGGPQELFRVDSAGQATPYQATASANPASAKVVSRVVNATSDSAGRQLAFYTYTRFGPCGGSERTYTLNAVTGALVVPSGPSGGGPYGFWVQSLWFDSAGTAYASLVPNLTTCTTVIPTGPLVPVGAKPIVCKLVGTHWVRVSEGLIEFDHGPGGWLAEQAGPIAHLGGYGRSVGNDTLTISHGGATKVTVPGVLMFAWAP